MLEKIINYMVSKEYRIDKLPNTYNIVYVEGMDLDGKLNNDVPNAFNDLRLVFTMVNDDPRIVGAWTATTEPGSHYTYSPMNPNGAARIKFDQYRAWKVGTHGNRDRHEALIQVMPVTVHRDFNKDFKRTNDKLFTGLFGINQHWGYDLPSNDIGVASAGCLVGRSRDGHREFMRLIKSDIRYKMNDDFIFSTAILPGNEL